MNLDFGFLRVFFLLLYFSPRDQVVPQTQILSTSPNSYQQFDSRLIQNGPLIQAQPLHQFQHHQPQQLLQSQLQTQWPTSIQGRPIKAIAFVWPGQQNQPNQNVCLMTATNQQISDIRVLFLLGFELSIF